MEANCPYNKYFEFIKLVQWKPLDSAQDVKARGKKYMANGSPHYQDKMGKTN